MDEGGGSTYVVQLFSFVPENTPCVFFELSVHCPASESLLNWNLPQLEFLTANLLPEQYLLLAAAIVDDTRASTAANCVKRMALVE